MQRLLHFTLFSGESQIAKVKGKIDKIEAIQISIDDIEQEPQRIVIATLLTLLLTGAGYGGLIAIERRNEAKYLEQFQDLSERQFRSILAFLR